MNVDLTDHFCPYQKAWIVDEADLKLARKGRQTGFTYGASFRVNRKCLEIPGLDWWWISRDERFGKDLVVYMMKWVALNNIVCEMVQWRTEEAGSRHPGRVYGNDSFMDLAKDVMVMQVTYPNKSRLNVLTSSPHAAAGKSGYVTIDEFDLHKNQTQLYGVVYPIRTWGGSLEIISTHEGGKASQFNQFIRDIEEKDNPMGWSYHKVTIIDAVNAGLVDKINRRRKQYGKEPLTKEEFINDLRNGCSSEEIWLEKYMCQPAEDKRALLPWEWITRAERDWGSLRVETRSGVTFVGMDIGRRRDLSVIWTVEKIGADLFTREIIEMEDTDYDDQEAALVQAVERWRPAKIAIDASTKGEMLGEHAVRRWGEHRVIAANMASSVTIATVATVIHVAFDRNVVRIPATPEIRRDLHAVEKHVGEAGKIKYIAPSHKDGHSDRFWALALALYAAGGDVGPIMAARLADDRVDRMPASGPYLMAQEEDRTAAEQRNDPWRGF